MSLSLPHHYSLGAHPTRAVPSYPLDSVYSIMAILALAVFIHHRYLFPIYPILVMLALGFAVRASRDAAVSKREK